MKRNLFAVMVAVALAAMVGFSTNVSAQPAAQTWSVVAHFEYVDGFSYDYVVARGVDTAFLTAALQACGQGHSHHAGAVVQFHCYPVPE